ncbi:unnamed protein product [Prunus armeniaca]
MYVVAPHSSQFVYMSVDIAIKEQQFFFSFDVFLKRENVVLYICFHTHCLIMAGLFLYVLCLSPRQIEVDTHSYKQ